MCGVMMVDVAHMQVQCVWSMILAARVASWWWGYHDVQATLCVPAHLPPVVSAAPPRFGGSGHRICRNEYERCTYTIIPHIVVHSSTLPCIQHSYRVQECGHCSVLGHHPCHHVLCTSVSYTIGRRIHTICKYIVSHRKLAVHGSMQRKTCDGWRPSKTPYIPHLQNLKLTPEMSREPLQGLYLMFASAALWGSNPIVRLVWLHHCPCVHTRTGAALRLCGWSVSLPRSAHRHPHWPCRAAPDRPRICYRAPSCQPPHQPTTPLPTSGRPPLAASTQLDGTVYTNCSTRAGHPCSHCQRPHRHRLCQLSRNTWSVSLSPLSWTHPLACCAGRRSSVVIGMAVQTLKVEDGNLQSHTTPNHKVWVAGAMALLGSLLLAADGSAAGMLGGITLGDGALMLAALLWSLHILRVGRCVWRPYRV